MNRIVLIGRLVRDPESRTTPSGHTITEFTLAVQKRIKPKDGGPDAEFVRCKAWGQSGDFLAKYGGKGRLVVADGRLESRKYTDKDGVNREVWEVIADQINLLDKAPDGGASAHPSANAPRPNTAPPADEYDPFADE